MKKSTWRYDEKASNWWLTKKTYHNQVPPNKERAKEKPKNSHENAL
jgi:hypothetical protein